MTTFDKTINDDLSHDDDSCGFTADTRLIVKRCLLLVKRAAFLLAERKRRKRVTAGEACLAGAGGRRLVRLLQSLHAFVDDTVVLLLFAFTKVRKDNHPVQISHVSLQNIHGHS